MMRNLLVSLLVLAMALAAHALTLTVSDKGVTVDAGGLGPLLLNPPVLLVDGDKETKPVEQRLNGAVAVFTYPGGAVAEVSVIEKTSVVITVKQVPAELKKLKMDMLLPFTLAQGGTWSIGGAPAQPFPETFADIAFLYQGNAPSIQLLDLQGKGFSAVLPQYTYQQLQDNRKWNWKIFQWMFLTPLQQGVATYTIKFSDADAKTGPVALADLFGQSTRAEYPGKLKTLEELRADVAAEQAYYAALTPPQGDVYGGLPGSGAKYGLTKTGFFHVEHNDKRWLLVDPEGNAWFHLGICCALQPVDDYTHIAGREALFTWLPPYEGEYKSAFRPGERANFSFYQANLIRKYGKPFDREEWSGRMIDRYRAWGFNSAGAFCGPTTTSQARQFPYVLTLPLGMWDGNMRAYLLDRVRGIFDPFNDKALAEIDRLCAKQLPERAEDPLLIGYFLANEQAFEDIPKVIPTLTGNIPAKARLGQMLREEYGTIDRFNAAWGLQAASFEALQTTGLPVTTKAAFTDMQAYTALFLEAYFKAIADTYHKYDQRHLLLGNRWMPSTANNQLLCQAAGKYMDVISVNYYTYGIDPDFLNRIYGWCGNKPMLLSEFHFSSPKESGLPGGMGEMATQRERGLAYRHYVEQAAALGYIVGIEWFSAVDQALTGRFFDTENGNIGLVSVTDRPYKDALAEMMKTNYGIYQVLFGARPPFVFDDPRFTRQGGDARRVVKAPRALPGLRVDGTLAGWPGTPPEPIAADRVVIGQALAGFSGAFRACYDDANLYLLVDVRDTTPMQNRHTGNMLWSADGIEVFLGVENLEQGGPLQFGDRQLLISAEKGAEGYRWYYANAPKPAPCTVAVAPAADGKGYTLTAAIPFTALGLTPKPGLTLLFDLAIDDSADGTQRLRQLMWNGIARNSSDRSHWGRLVLSE